MPARWSSMYRRSTARTLSGSSTAMAACSLLPSIRQCATLDAADGLMALIFPTLPGLAWSVTKTPTFQTRIQRAASGRELRALDYPYPLWQFALVYDFLRDNPTAGHDELRTLIGFFMLCQGAFG